LVPFDAFNVYLHTLLHTCCARRFMISKPKCNMRNSNRVLVIASVRKRRNISHRSCEYIFLLIFIIFEDLLQQYPTRGPPGCVMRPACTIVNYKYILRITQLFRRLSISLITIFTNKVREQAHNYGTVASPYKGWAPLPRVISGPLIKCR